MISHMELRIHLTKGYWYTLCKKHFLNSKLKNKQILYTHRYVRNSISCDVPWCKEKLVREIYPQRKIITSFWYPGKEKK